MGTFLRYFLPAWIGIGEYQEVTHARPQTSTLTLRFYGRLFIAAAGFCFFLWQQLVEPPAWWGSNTFAIFLLGLTVSQASGPLFYLLFKCTKKFFLTKHYLETLGKGKFYFTLKSAICIPLMTVLSILAAYGFLGDRWYVKLFVFLLTVPVAWFFVLIPALNWVGIHWIGFPKGFVEKGKLKTAPKRQATTQP
jgi:hypothetical protein